MKRAKIVKRTKSAPINIADLIDRALQRKISVIEKGRQIQVTIFEAIYLQLWTKEMAGDVQAFKVRCAYDKLAIELSPKKKREIIVIGGLPG